MSRPGWLTYSGRFTYTSGHPSAAGRAQDSESSSVIPPSHRRRGAIAVLLRCQYGINRSGTAMIAVVPQWFRH